MARTTDEIANIARTLNGVQTTGQARIVIGRTLEALSAAYELLDEIPTQLGVPVVRERYLNTLNTARANLEDWYPKIPGSGNEDYRTDWARNRWRVEKAYAEIAGVEGAADYVPRTSNWEILSQALKEAPGVFGETVGDVLNKAAETAGKVGAGLAKGLGGWGWAGIVLVVVIVVVVMGGKQAVLTKLTGGSS